MRGRGVHVQRPRQHTMPHRHHHLDHTGHTRSRLRMPQVRLHRTQPQRPLLRPVLPISGDQRLRLDRVTQRRTRTVRLHHIHITGRQTTTGQRLPDHPLLRRTIRRRQTIRRTILVHRTAPHHRQHPMTVAPRIRQPLQHQHTDTLGPTHPIGRVGERLAAAVGGEGSLAGELDERGGSGHDGDTTGHGERALPGAQRLGRPVQGDEGRRARRVHRHRRTLESERVGHPARGDAAGAAVAAVSLVLLVGEDAAVVVVHDAGEDAGLAAPQGDRVHPGPLDRLPRRLQQQPLLRVRRHRLPRTHPEEVRIEVTRIVQETTRPRVRRPRHPPVRAVQGLHVPPTVRRELRHRVRTLGHQPPQILRRRHPTRITARHPHDHHRIVRHRRQRGHRHDDIGDGAEHGVQEVGGEQFGGRVVEDHRGGQPQSGRLAEPVAQFDCCQ